MNTVDCRFNVIRPAPSNAAPATAEIYLYSPIGDYYGGITAKQFIDSVNAVGEVERLVLNVNSPGGSVFDADAMFNALQRHPAREKICNIDGLAASAACTVAMAFPVRNMAANAMMMIHRAADCAFGDADEIRKSADVLDQIDASIRNTYAAATGLSPEAVGDAMDVETWMDAAMAKELGFATSITEQRKAAALAGLTAQSVARLPAKHRDKLAAFIGNAASAPPGSEPAPATPSGKDNAMADTTTPAPAPAPAAEPQPVNVAELAKPYLAAFGEVKGAQYFAQGKSMDESRNLHLADLTAANAALTAQVAELTKRLAAANSALGTDPVTPTPANTDEAAQAEAAELEKLTKAFNGDAERAAKTLARRKAARAKK